MTRGTLFLICDELIIKSIEFNGDMYPDGHGQEIIKCLEETETGGDFSDFIEKFNKENHGYKDVESLIFPLEKSRYINNGKVVMTDDNYFEDFFSDWTFWKNISKKAIKIKTIDSSKLITLLPNEQVAINFGGYERHYKSSLECAEIIKREEEEYKKEQEKRKSTIESKSLYYREGNSNKEYHMQVIKIGEGDSGYMVKFQFGRVGTKLREGDKTALPTTLPRALNVFNETLREKQRKGYR